MTAADARAARDRARPAPDATVGYGRDAEQIADLRRPAPRPGPPRPLVVVIHGGFWRAGYDRTHTDPLAAELVARGYPVAQLEYRRTGQPGGGWPGTLDDVRAGVDALPRLFADALPGTGAAPGPPILLGHSAGGQLALHCAASEPAGVRGVLALAPVADLAEAYRLDLDDGAVAALLGGGPDRFPARYAAADPLARPALRTPTIVMHGALDRHVPVAIGRRYAETAGAAGGQVALVELPECEHFALISPGSAWWPEVLTALQSLHG
jgi:acetyl esterase/lipase